jgi:GT2 family glycosyltransferase
MTAMSTPFFSVIICSIDPWNFAQVSTQFERLLREVPFEIIGIHDAKSLAEGYNRGLKRARGEIVIFSHDDVIFLDNQFAQKISERMQSWDVLGFLGIALRASSAGPDVRTHYAGAFSGFLPRHINRIRFSLRGAWDWPIVGNATMLDGLCIIAHHHVATAIGFDADTFDGWMLYDLDFSFAAHLAGYKIGICCDIPLIHKGTNSGGTADVYATDIYQKYSKRIYGKYGNSAHRLLSSTSPSLGCLFSDHESLKMFWTEDVLRRATLSMDRRPAGEIS